MKILLREKPRTFQAECFTPEMVLGTEPLAEGIVKSRSRPPQIVEEKWTDGKGVEHTRQPKERIVTHHYHFVNAKGEKRPIFIGDYIRKGPDGSFERMVGAELDNYEVVEPLPESEPAPAAPVKRPSRPAKQPEKAASEP